MPEITIAVCVYNGEKYIAQTLSCIVAQTLQSFELLIVDDGSTDDTVQIIHDFFEKHPRDYRIVCLKTNQGIASARQTALEHAQTRYLAFIDADDLPYPALLEKEYRLISSDKNILAVSCWSEYIDHSGKKLAGGLYLGDRTKEDFLSRTSRRKLIFLPIQTLFERQAAWDAGGFRLDGFPEGKPRYRDFCEDLDLWTRLSDRYTEGKYIITIPEVLYAYRKSPAGLSSNTIVMIQKMKYIKANLLRRRNGEAELSFIDFYNGLSAREKKEIQKEARAADSLRNGVFSLKKGQWIKALVHTARSVGYSPGYVWQKIKSNSGLFK